MTRRYLTAAMDKAVYFPYPRSMFTLQPLLKLVALPMPYIFILLLSFSLVSCASDGSSKFGIFHASQSGYETLDQGSGGGNPFASALIELLGTNTNNLEEFSAHLTEITQRNSYDFQTPDVPVYSSQDLFNPLETNENRQALIFVFSNYTPQSGMPSLEGARRDALRLEKAFSAAGFNTTMSVDPNPEQLLAALEEFASRSQTADTAAIYTTGHGVESKDTVYLLPLEYELSKGETGLNEGALKVAEFEKYMFAKKNNLLFFGGCRNNPWTEVEDE